MTKPFFSIVIPALNEESYLPHLLEDLANQSYRDFEVIVVDGKSEDKTIIETKKFAKLLPKLTIYTSTRRHVCTQRNLGASYAKGEYLIFMDADNRLPTYFLLGIKYKLESDPAQLATTYADTAIKSEYPIINTINLSMELGNRINSPGLLEAMVIVSREVFHVVDGFDEQINFAEGPDLAKRICELGYVYNIYHNPQYTYSLRRIHKFGAIKIARNIAIHQLNLIFGEELSQTKVKELYPMKGGQLFSKPKHSKTREFTRAVDNLLRNISLNDKPVTIKTLKKQLNSLLS